MNFTETGMQGLKVIPKSHVYGFDKSTLRVDFILSNTSRFTEDNLKPNDDDHKVTAASKAGISFHIFINTFGWLSLLLTIVGLFCEIDLMTPLLHFIRMTKPISRFKFINVRGGNIIEAFLSNYQDLFRTGAFVKTDKNVIFTRMSRTKLLRYYVPVFTFSTIPDKYIVYSVVSCHQLLIFLKLLQAKLKKYGHKGRNLTADDESLVKLVERIKLPVYFFLIFDVIFYTSHTLSHQAILGRKSNDAIISYVLAMLMLSLLTFDTVTLVLDILHLKRPTKYQMLEQLLVTKIKAAKKALPHRPLTYILKLFKKNHLQNLNKTYSEFEAKLSFRPAEDRFVLGGIKPEAVDLRKPARLFNLLTALKSMAMEIMFATMQLTNSLQIACLLLIQLLYVGYLIYCVKCRIFKSKFYVVVVMGHEICLLGYFSLTCAIHASGDTIYKLIPSSEDLQVVTMTCLILAIMFGVAIMVEAIIGAFRRLKSNKVGNKLDEENSKILNDITDRMEEPGYLEALVEGKEIPPLLEEKSGIMDVSFSPLKNKRKQVNKN